MDQEGETGQICRDSSNVHKDDRYTHVDSDPLPTQIEGYTETQEEEKLDNDPDEKSASSKKGKVKKEIKKIKIILIGEKGSGKTSLIKRYVKNQFDASEQESGSAEQSKTIDIDSNLAVELTIGDTAEEEKLGKFTKNYYKDAHGALVVFDLTNQQSFQNLKSWMEEIHSNAPEDIVLCIIGNKSDLTADRKVKNEDAKDLAKDNIYYEVSAKNGNNVSLAFEQLIYGIIEKQKEEEKNPSKVIRGEEGRQSINLSKKKEDLKVPKKSQKCCNIF